MTAAKPTARRGIYWPAGEGRAYRKAGMTGIFKADGVETANAYSLSEWWLDPHTQGIGIHTNPHDHIYYVLEGVLTVFLDDRWVRAEQGAVTVIPAGVAHDFENREDARVGFLSIDVPGGFERTLTRIGFEHVPTAKDSP